MEISYRESREMVKDGRLVMSPSVVGLKAYLRYHWIGLRLRWIDIRLKILHGQLRVIDWLESRNGE